MAPYFQSLPNNTLFRRFESRNFLINMVLLGYNVHNIIQLIIKEKILSNIYSPAKFTRIGEFDIEIEVLNSGEEIIRVFHKHIEQDESIFYYCHQQNEKIICRKCHKIADPNIIAITILKNLNI